ncbi:hypothetical protein EJB05_00260 [Eragrostis curvula]|uniref:Aminotransferase-like plant mobile domain-containing protein n=1 Tax=Eragrostis curvula TaxID=38414 RepID=A0A5J9WLK6_9POAL|nr:hypothetical protein EJB05_00260 [Eragrostis curvula]
MVCMPAKFAAMCSNLTPRQRKKVKETGLDSLLCVPRMPIQRMLLELIAERYNVDDRSFTLGDHVVPISTWDVYCILGLVDRGHEVVQNRGRPDMAFFNMFRGKGDTSITFKHLEAEIASGIADDHFARVFVLYAIGTILAPSSKESVSSGYLEIVRDVSKIKDFNWARFTLEYLVQHLASFKDDRSKGLPGNLALLQVWYFEHFQADGDCFDYAKHEHPLIKNWSTTKVKKRALIDGIKKFGAEKVLIRLEVKHNECPDSDHLDEEIYEEDTEGVNVEFSKYKECSDQDEKEEINLEGLHKAEQSDECHRKRIINQFDGSTGPTACEDKHDEKKDDQKNSGNGKVQSENSTVKNGTNNSKGNRGNPCREPVHPEQPNKSGVKRKVDFSSPTLVQKVKTRRDRQPSKNCRSPYEGIKRKNVCGTKIDGHHIDNITKGLHLSAVELAAIKYVGQELALNKDKVLVQMGTPSDMSEMNGTIMRCLIRPVRENGMDKWLDSEIIGSYAHMCNSVWGSEPKQKKHAISDYRSQWLRGIGSGWIHPREKVTDYICSCGLFTIKFMQYWNGTRLTCNFSQADMEEFRKKMPADLIFSALNEVSSTKKAILDMVNA